MFVTAADVLGVSTLKHICSSCIHLVVRTLLICAGFLYFDISLRLQHQFLLLLRNSVSFQFFIHPQRKTLSVICWATCPHGSNSPLAPSRHVQCFL